MAEPLSFDVFPSASCNKSTTVYIDITIDETTIEEFKEQARQLQNCRIFITNNCIIAFVGIRPYTTLDSFTAPRFRLPVVVGGKQKTVNSKPLYVEMTRFPYLKVDSDGWVMIRYSDLELKTYFTFDGTTPTYENLPEEMDTDTLYRMYGSGLTYDKENERWIYQCDVDVRVKKYTSLGLSLNSIAL